MIAKKLPRFEFSWPVANSTLFCSKRKGAETTRCQWLWTFRFSLWGRFMPRIRPLDAMIKQRCESCLESRTITPFPTTTRRVPYHTDTKKITVPIFCVSPSKWQKEYVQCSQCCSWYHPNCVMVPEWAIKTKRKWQCQKWKNRRTLRLSNSLVWVMLCFPVVRDWDLDRVCVLVMWVGGGGKAEGKQKN